MRPTHHGNGGRTWTALLLAVLFPVVGVWLAPTQPLRAQTKAQAQGVNLTHIHGLGYLSGPGERLLVGTHHGLSLYDGERWSLMPAPIFDYMGLAVSDRLIYASGHPAPGTDSPNPLGLIASEDGGKNFNAVSLSGQADFHILAAGRRSKTLYVIVRAPNSAMPHAGLYRSTNLGLSWQNISTDGVPDPRAVAAHPDHPGIVALAGKDGIYILRLSVDGGRVLRRLAKARAPRMVAFANDGKSLWYGGFSESPYLMHLPLPDGPPQPLPLPNLGRTTLTYLVQHPTKPQTLALATVGRHVLVTADGGKNWRIIAAKGKPR